mmetsp:Transcript_2094/g.13590  ORF Transcript_2094/g.13590 Transcript_2094/m.13590 type:complete len:90 (+) Transcript_2094:3060-3329(+)
MNALSPSMQYARIIDRVADSWCFILPIRLVRLSLARAQVLAIIYSLSHQRFAREALVSNSGAQVYEHFAHRERRRSPHCAYFLQEKGDC